MLEYPVQTHHHHLKLKYSLKNLVALKNDWLGHLIVLVLELYIFTARHPSLKYVAQDD